MHIIVDGYNLLAVTGFDERDKLLRNLEGYHHRKGHEVTIVFDGTHQGTGSGDRFYSKGVEVIFSPLTVTADDTIEKMLSPAKASRTLVVSSDRKIQSAARRVGATFISSQEFWCKLQETPAFKPKNILKPWEEGRMDDEPTKFKRGPSRKLSKTERQKKRKLDQL